MSDMDLTGPATADELSSSRWLDHVIASRDVGIEKYTPRPLRSALTAEQDAVFEVPVSLGVLRGLHRYIARLKARELR